MNKEENEKAWANGIKFFPVPENNGVFYGGIATFKLSELEGKTLTIKTIKTPTEDNRMLIMTAGKDIKTGTVFVLESRIEEVKKND
jgi:hypothetical protein